MVLAAIQGIRGSYSEEAARSILGAGAEILECRDFNETFDAVANSRAEYAVVPVINKIVGTIEVPVRLMKTRGMRMMDKLVLPVRHILAGVPGAKIEKITSVRSHIEALRQCSVFLAARPGMMQISGEDTASSVRRVVAQGDKTAGAIGSRRAAEIYGAAILREDIANDADNWTTFYLLGN